MGHISQTHIRNLGRAGYSKRIDENERAETLEEEGMIRAGASSSCCDKSCIWSTRDISMLGEDLSGTS